MLKLKFVFKGSRWAKMQVTYLKAVGKHLRLKEVVEICENPSNSF
jgi:hypothetical protein